MSSKNILGISLLKKNHLCLEVKSFIGYSGSERSPHFCQKNIMSVKDGDFMAMTLEISQDFKNGGIQLKMVGGFPKSICKMDNHLSSSAIYLHECSTEEAKKVQSYTLMRKILKMLNKTSL